MKCQNCGKKEVNFHYSTNINGCVTETHLCSECAAKSGYDFGQIFDTGNIFNEFFPIMGRPGGFLPVAVPMMGLNYAFPFAARPGIAGITQTSTCGNGCQTNVEGAQTASVDGEMKKRRELYMQMRIAAENEDFERAAELRDKIKELEK